MPRYAKLSSSELVRACAGSKDDRAWAEFIRRFQVVIATAVLRTAHRWGEKSRPHLDDLIQDTYLKLCENDSLLLRSFEPRHEESIYGFLKVVAANVVHDHFKSASAAKRGAGQADAILDPLQIDSKAANRILSQVTAGKDQERNRTIFWLRHRQGLTASEIAAIPSVRLTTEGVECVLLRLAIMIRGHISSSTPHREVKVLPRKNRSKRSGS